MVAFSKAAMAASQPIWPLSGAHAPPAASRPVQRASKQGRPLAHRSCTLSSSGAAAPHARCAPTAPARRRLVLSVHRQCRGPASASPPRRGSGGTGARRQARGRRAGCRGEVVAVRFWRSAPRTEGEDPEGAQPARGEQRAARSGRGGASAPRRAAPRPPPPAAPQSARAAGRRRAPALRRKFSPALRLGPRAPAAAPAPPPSRDPSGGQRPRRAPAGMGAGRGQAGCDGAGRGRPRSACSWSRGATPSR